MVGENFKAVFLFALAWLTTSCASDAPKAQVSLSNSPHLLKRRQTGSGGQQSPPPDNCDFLQFFTFVKQHDTSIAMAIRATPYLARATRATQYFYMVTQGNTMHT
jgi:hypothetical protein